MLFNTGDSIKSVITACYLVSRSPSSAIDYNTPEEVCSGTLLRLPLENIWLPYAHVFKCIFLSNAHGIRGTDYCVLNRDLLD